MAVVGSILTKPLPPLTEEYLRELFGDPLEDEQRRREFRISCEYEEANHDELRARYPDRWVAIFGCRVVGDGASLREVVALLWADPSVRAESAVVSFMDQGRTGEVRSQ